MKGLPVSAGRCGIFTLGLVFGSILSAEVPAPRPVSPGDGLRATLVEDRCPTFGWGVIDGAEAYEVRVYAIGDEAAEPRPVVTQEIPGTASGWTPPLDACLERGGVYAWTVRARRSDGYSEWSIPIVFGVARSPSHAELGPLNEEDRRADPSERENRIAGSRHGEENLGKEAPSPLPRPTFVEGPIYIGQVPATLMVQGEIRSIDEDGYPRLWGRGRTIIVYGIEGATQKPCGTAEYRYGLSEKAVDWGSAAHACPSDTWVCEGIELFADAGTCDTQRPDGAVDGIACNGTAIDFAEGWHRGWVESNTSGSSTTEASVVREGISGAFNAESYPTCTSLPVWCCWHASGRGG